MNFLFKWIVLSMAVVVSANFVDGIIVDSILSAFIAGVVLTFIQGVIKPLVRIFSLPINLFTFGLFSILMNGLFFWGVSILISGFSVSGYGAAIIGALIVSALNWIGDRTMNV